MSIYVTRMKGYLVPADLGLKGRPAISPYHTFVMARFDDRLVLSIFVKMEVT
jgi:hypothetical protein